MARSRVALLALGAASLIAGVAGGLARLGLPVDAGTAAVHHGALMVSAFLGTVIGLERAVALGRPFAYGAPLCSGTGGLALLLAPSSAAGAALLIAAPLILALVSAAIARREPATHTRLLLAATLCWLAGNAFFAAGAWHVATTLGFAFLVLTIAAERLEMTRLTPRPQWASPLFVAIAAILALSAAALAIDVRVASIVFGAALLALAAWLASFDIARRTLRAAGFARYAAIALLAGYAWLALAGFAWIALPFAPSARDTALHALGLGFVFSMIFAHAPLVVPVVARLRMRFIGFFYVPLALLHVSVALRLAAGFADPALRAAGGAFNAATIVLFVATLVYAVRTAPRPAPA